MKSYDIIIVGGGILGVSHAYHCLNANLKVALVERNPYPMDASVRNFGQIVPSGFLGTWQDYARRSLVHYNDLQAKTELTVQTEGSLYVASNEEEEILITELYHINQQNNYPCELWNKALCLQTQPHLNQQYVQRGLFFPKEMKVDPRKLTRKLINYLHETTDLDYYPHTPVNSILDNGSIEVSSQTGLRLKADKVFLCCGTEFELLYPVLFRNSDIQKVKIQMLETVPQYKTKIKGSLLTGWTIRRYESFQKCPSYSRISALESPDDYHKKHGVHILFKQSADGSIIVGDSHHYQDISDGCQMDERTDAILNQFMIDEASKIVHFDTAAIRRTWQGYYSQVPDEKNIFNQTIGSNIHIVTAIGGKGMSASLGYAEAHVSHCLNLNNIL